MIKMPGFYPLSVVKAPTTEHALQDCVYVNSEMDLLREGELCVVTDGQRSLSLPVKAIKEVPIGKITLNAYQRRAIWAALNQSIHFSIADTKVNGFPLFEELPKVSRVGCQITLISRRDGDEPSIDDVIRAIKNRLLNHPLNLDHAIPVRVNCDVYRAAIKDLAGEICALMNDDCEIMMIDT